MSNHHQLVTVSVRIPKEAATAARDLAKSQNKSVSQIITDLLLEEHNKDSKNIH